MMTAMKPPPFERFYVEHRDDVWRFLVRRLGRDTAEDAFQETFLRALRAYGRLEHGRHLRAWAYAIAARVAIDELRRRGRFADRPVPETATAESRPGYVELAELTDGLPPTERAAVVLRYAFDLPYAEIGALLASSEEAARQAASAGVRRLRKRKEFA
jgi:RNA polymerase sigma factor (sigma-70 family)